MRRRPGVTAAPTTAAFATGDGPGVTAAPTTAAFATGERPGPIAEPTTAALATGEGPGVTAAVTTAAFATRLVRSGMVRLPLVRLRKIPRQRLHLPRPRR